MPNTKDVTPDNRGLFALFKGPASCGKSVAAYSFPKLYVFDFDKKMPKVALKHFPEKEIHWDTFTSMFDVVKKLEEFSNYCPYETLFFDSITSLVNLVLKTIGDTKGESVVKLLMSLTKSKTVELMGIDYYAGETAFIQRFFLEALQQLWVAPGNPRHIIVSAHVLESESAPDLKTKIVTRHKSILTAGRKVAAYIPTVFDDCFHFGYKAASLGADDKTIRRLVFTQNIGDDDARTSYNLPVEIDFTGKSFYDIMYKANCFGNRVSTL